MSDAALIPARELPVAPAGRAGTVVRATPSAPGAATGDESEWVVRARGGDEEAFRMLVDRHRDHAYGLALRITRSREDAADVAQEAFVRAWRALPRFRGESAFGTWLHRIVARRALDRAQQLRSRALRETAVEEAGLLPAPAPAGDGGALVRRLERLVAGLSPAQRAAVTLYYAGDHPVEAIAVTLGLPENTVKTHLSRARAALREAWRREEEGA